MKEQWVAIKGYEGIYEVSNLGQVRSLDRMIEMSHGGIKFQVGRVLKRNTDNLGYLKVNLYDDKRNRKTWRIHTLVGLHFVDNPNGYTHVNLKDNNQFNVSMDNLKWVSDKDSDSKGARLGNVSSKRKGA